MDALLNPTPIEQVRERLMEVELRLTDVSDQLDNALAEIVRLKNGS